MLFEHVRERQLYRHLNRELDNPDVDEATKNHIRSVLSDGDMFDVLHDMVQSKLDNDSVQADVTPSPTPRQHPILMWLWDHRAEILAFVLQIVAMFGLHVPLPVVPTPVTPKV